MFHPIAEGQIRGVPWVAPAMVRLWLLDQYDDAELDRKKVAAKFAGFATRPGPDDVMGEDGAQKDADGAALIGLQPGTMQLLLPGEDIKFSDPADVGGSYEAFQYRTLLACCAAMGVPYTNVTGDLRQANYSSLREGTISAIAQGETRFGTTQGGTPTSLTFNRISQFQGSIKRAGSPVGNLTGGSVTYSNNLENIEAIRDDGLIEGADPTSARRCTRGPRTPASTPRSLTSAHGIRRAP